MTYIWRPKPLRSPVPTTTNCAMKLSPITVVLAAATGLVSSAPIVIVYSSGPRNNLADAAPVWAQKIRWGHAAVAPKYDLGPLELTRSWFPTPTYNPGAPEPTRSWAPMPTPDLDWARFTSEFLSITDEAPRQHRGGCRMRKMKNQSLQWGNKLRAILGLPSIETLHPWTPPRFATETLIGADGKVIYTKKVPVSLPTHHRHHMRPLHHRSSFAVRLSHALASLGPWEGRAVSFVLGCGLGVLLRMLFVFGVLIVRSVRGRREERRIALEEDTVIFVADVKEPILVEALPAYAEKSEAQAEDAPQTNNAN